MILITKINYHSNDMYADIGECDCKMFPDNPDLDFCKKTQKAIGYNDLHFYEKVNANPKVFQCSICKWTRYIQWTQNGVKVWTKEEFENDSQNKI